MPSQSLTTSAFTSLDWLLLAIVLISTLLAFRRGIIRVLFSLGGLIAGILLAAWNYVAFSAFLNRWIISPQVAQIVAFFGILAGVMIAFGLAAGFLRKLVKTIGLGFLDRLAGAVFGLARGVLLGVAVLMGIAAFSPDADWAQKSTLAPYFLAGAHAVSFVVPKDFEQQIAKGASVVLHETPELMRPHTLTQAPE